MRNKILAMLATVVLVGLFGYGVYLFFTALDRSMQPQLERQQREDDQAIAACTRAGGFIVRSSWGGRIVDCKVIR